VSNPTGDLGRFAEPSLLILISLADGPKHGYAMMDDIRQLANVKLGPGTLYGAIARLEQRGLIEPVDSEDRRRPYRLTPSGSTALREQLTTIEALATTGLERIRLA
jgi:DNA-binding PadR family transcriptional regulator